jgi:hypothetical protein
MISWEEMWPNRNIVGASLSEEAKLIPRSEPATAANLAERSRRGEA